MFDLRRFHQHSFIPLLSLVWTMWTFWPMWRRCGQRRSGFFLFQKWGLLIVGTAWLENWRTCRTFMRTRCVFLHVFYRIREWQTKKENYNLPRTKVLPWVHMVRLVRLVPQAFQDCCQTFVGMARADPEAPLGSIHFQLNFAGAAVRACRIDSSRGLAWGRHGCRKGNGCISQVDIILW